MVGVQRRLERAPLRTLALALWGGRVGAARLRLAGLVEIHEAVVLLGQLLAGTDSPSDDAESAQEDGATDTNDYADDDLSVRRGQTAIVVVAITVSQVGIGSSCRDGARDDAAAAL